MLVHHYVDADQQAFAELSGDYNPLHLDPVYARRLVFGRPLVHGVHAAIRALDGWLAERAGPIHLTDLQVVFEAPIPVGARCEVRFREKCANGEPGEPGVGSLEIDVSRGDELMIRLRAGWRRGRDALHDTAPEIPNVRPARGACRPLTLDAASQASGEVLLSLDIDLATRLFPRAARRLPPAQLASLLCMTRLVGMECPGLNSVLCELDLEFNEACDSDTDAGEPVLRYAIERVDRRFGLAVMRVSSAAVRGRVRALFRSEPCTQPGYGLARCAVRAGEFAAQHALVVGGSRGLGELCAKLLAAGGARVVLTYQRGADDARRVVAEIEAGGGSAQCLLLDVEEVGAAAAALGEVGLAPSHLYYFATPPIFVARRAGFSREIFERFSRFYVSGFHEILEVCRTLNPEFGRALYPSSVALDQPPIDMAEYCAAKAAGESLCATLAQSSCRLTIARPRLPRLATDQTASVISHETPDPIPVLLGHLRALRDA